ncbi:hypothetical protein [Sulfitobacter sp. PS-8MA]|uniref:hypothetical protein n=1 Tax=Sulfitobacter sp. PS-8MA TaxID=3237707 RepID=UPI0034C67A1A
MAGELNMIVYEPPLALLRRVSGIYWHKRASNSPAHRWLRAQIALLMEPLNTEAAPLPKA